MPADPPATRRGLNCGGVDPIFRQPRSFAAHSLFRGSRHDRTQSRRAALVALAPLVAMVPSAHADEIPVGAVQPATASAPVAAGGAASPVTVRFQQRDTLVGDRIVQRMGMQLGVATKIVQSGQIANESTSDVRSQQQRTVDVLEVAEGRAVRGAGFVSACAAGNRPTVRRRTN